MVDEVVKMPNSLEKSIDFLRQSDALMTGPLLFWKSAFEGTMIFWITVVLLPYNELPGCTFIPVSKRQKLYKKYQVESVHVLVGHVLGQKPSGRKSLLQGHMLEKLRVSAMKIPDRLSFKRMQRVD